jgi:hypothetical protein
MLSDVPLPLTNVQQMLRQEACRCFAPSCLVVVFEVIHRGRDEGQLKDLSFDDAIGIVLNAVLAEGEMIQYGFEQSIAGFDQLQIGDPFFHFRRFGRLRQLLHQGQFVGRIAPRRRLVGAFVPQPGIEQRPGYSTKSAKSLLFERHATFPISVSSLLLRRLKRSNGTHCVGR